MTADLAGSNGFAAIPAAALDPPHAAASPAVPALMGPGPQVFQDVARLGACELVSQEATAIGRAPRGPGARFSRAFVIGERARLGVWLVAGRIQ